MARNRGTSGRYATAPDSSGFGDQRRRVSAASACGSRCERAGQLRGDRKRNMPASCRKRTRVFRSEWRERSRPVVNRIDTVNVLLTEQVYPSGLGSVSTEPEQSAALQSSRSILAFDRGRPYLLTIQRKSVKVEQPGTGTRCASGRLAAGRSGGRSAPATNGSSH